VNKLLFSPAAVGMVDWRTTRTSSGRQLYRDRRSIFVRHGCRRERGLGSPRLPPTL